MDSKAEHFTFEEPFEDENAAAAAMRIMARRLIRELKDKGFVSFAPPPRPTSFDGEWDEFADCRILVAWIPDWIPTRHAGKFVCRVDTLASK